MTTLADAIQAEQARLNTKLEEIAKQRRQLDEEEARLRVELSAIQAYEDAKSGKATARVLPAKVSTARSPKKTGVRQQVLDIIMGAPSGIARQELLTRMGAEDDKPAQQAISNALVVLRKNNKITGERGIYKPVAVGSTAPFEPSVRRVRKDEASA